MNVDRKLVVVGVVALFLVVASAGVLAGVDRPLKQAEEQDSTSSKGKAPADSGGGSVGAKSSDSDAGTPRTPEPRAFDMDIDSVESCGQTCRDVTATITNEQDREATGVTVYTQIFAGDSTQGDLVWEATQDVGTLAPGESSTATKRIELGFMDAAAIKAADGKITIRLTVETNRDTETFIEHRDVA